MKKYFGTGGAILIALLAFYYAIGDFSSRIPPMPKGLEQSIGTKENPHARSEYETMRLLDPRTGVVPKDIRKRELAFSATLPTDGMRRLMKTSGGITFNRRGPHNVGGRTRALAIDAANENSILSGGVSGGMWRSTNGGTSWNKMITPDQLHSVTCILQDVRSGKRNVWYYGTGEVRGNSASETGAPYRGDGIYKSIDSGLTWTPLASTITNSPHIFNDFDYVNNLATDASNASEDEIYAAIYGAIMRSTNGGDTWTRVLGRRASESGNKGQFTEVEPGTDGVLYATISAYDNLGSYNATDKGIWRSTDGIAWVNITPPSLGATYRRLVIAVAPSNQNILYVLAETPGSGKQNAGDGEWISLWKYTYISGDGSGAGGTWVDLSPNVPMLGQPVGDFNTQGSYNLIIKVKPDNPNVVFVGGTNLYRSTDGFATTSNTAWIGGYATANDISQYANHHPDQHALAFKPSNLSVLYSGHDGGVSRTDNCLASSVAWSTLNNGYYTTQFYTVGIEKKTTGVLSVGGGMQDNGSWGTRSSIASFGWKEFFSGDGAAIAFSSTTSSIYVSAQTAIAYRLKVDASWNETGWTRIDPQRGTSPFPYLFITPYVLDANDEKMMYLAGGDRVWRQSDLTAIPLFSQNPATTGWTELTATATGGQYVTALATSSTPANVLFYGTSSKNVFRIDNANTGTPSPVNITSNISVPTGSYVTSIGVHPADANKVVIGYSNYGIVSVWYTTNALSATPTWTAVAGNLEENSDGSGAGPSVRSVRILPVAGTDVFLAGTSTGLYATNALNGMSTLWVRQGENIIGNVVVNAIEVRPADGFVAVATHGNGVFTASITDAGVVSAHDLRETPADFYLGQNYPNPFNPSTTITFSLQKEGYATLKVYSSRGQEVATLVDGIRPRGKQSVHFDASALAGGVYFYTLSSRGLTQSGKMLLIK